MTKLLGLAFIASTAALTVGCADNDDGAFTDAAAEVEGIYKVTTHTRNEAACLPGGTLVQIDESFAIAYTQEIFGMKMLGLMSCASAADCRQKVADIRAQETVLSDFYFATSDLDGDVLVGRGASTGSLEGGACIGGARLDTRFELAGSLLRVQQRVTRADAYAPKDGGCWSDDASKSAEGKTCSELEQVTLELVEAL